MKKERTQEEKETIFNYHYYLLLSTGRTFIQDKEEKNIVVSFLNENEVRFSSTFRGEAFGYEVELL